MNKWVTDIVQLSFKKWLFSEWVAKSHISGITLKITLLELSRNIQDIQNNCTWKRFLHNE